MSKNLYIASTAARSGKSLIALGLMAMLSGRTGRVGFFRPVVPSRDAPDRDIQLMTERFGGTGTIESGFGVSFEQTRKFMTSGDPDGLLKAILTAYSEMEERCDFVLCEGTDYRDYSSAFEFGFNAEVARNLQCPVLLVVNGRGRAQDEIADTVRVAHDTFRNSDCEVIAAIANRVDPDKLGEVQAHLEAQGRDDLPTYAIPEDPALNRATVGDVARQLGAALIHGDPVTLQREIDDVKVAAMEVPHFLQHLRPGSLVITPGDRADIIVASFIASISTASKGLAGLLLTGGLRPELQIRNLLKGVEENTLPVLSIDDDTYETATRLYHARSSLSPDNERKIAKALRLFESCVDVPVLEASIDLARSDTVTPIMFEHMLIRRAARHSRRIVLTEGEEERILRAAEILIRRGVAKIIVLGNEQVIRQKIATLALDLDDVRIIDPNQSELLQEYADTYFELRKHKGITPDNARDVMRDASYFGTMMVHLDHADGMVSGAVNTTAHTVRPAFEFIRPRPGVSIVSSVFFMCLEDRVLVYGDCAVNPKPTAEQLADIAISAAATARVFRIEPRVAMLSYSTGESGHGSDVDKVREATQLVKERAPDLAVEGPIQYDAAADPSVAATKMPDSDVAGRATVFIFPDLNAGNNAYKAVQRSAGAVAVGPVLQGLNKPVNDLSRGCTVTDIVNTVAITAIQSAKESD